MAQTSPASEPPHSQFLSRLVLSEEVNSYVIRKGSTRRLPVLVTAAFRPVSPHSWSSSSMGRVMGCRAHRSAGTKQPTKIKTNKDQRWTMLAAHPIYPVLLATDLGATKEFYHDRLGLEILNENDDALTF